MIGFAVGYQPGGADLPRPRGPRRDHPGRARQGRDRTRGPPAASTGPRSSARTSPRSDRSDRVRLAAMSDPRTPTSPALTFDRPSDGVLRITLDAPGLNAVGPAAHGQLADVWRVVDRDPGHAGGAAAGRRQGVLRRRELRADRLGDQRRRRPAAHPARGARPGGEPHRLQHADRVGGARARPSAPGWWRRCSPTCPWSVAPPASSTGTPASAWRPATTRRSAGRCCAAWPRPSTCCSPATRSPARRPSASAWCRSASTTTRCRTGRSPSPSSWRPAQQRALQFTKHTLNHWYRAQLAAFDASLAYEFLGFGIGDADEGLAAHVEKREPRFNQ